MSDKQKTCVFCDALDQLTDEENLIVHRGRSLFVMLNRYPYTSGHLMVIPNAHLDSLDMLDSETLAELMALTAKAVKVLRQEYQPQGFNVGINEGAAAGAGIEDHLHLHVVPRWSGDTNFMSAVADVRVLPEALEDTLRRVITRWNKTT